MGVLDIDLSPNDIVIVIVNGNETPTVVKISFIVSTESYNLLTYFVITSKPSLQNIITGHHWLHKLRVLSTHAPPSPPISHAPGD